MVGLTAGNVQDSAADVTSAGANGVDDVYDDPPGLDHNRSHGPLVANVRRILKEVPRANSRAGYPPARASRVERSVQNPARKLSRHGMVELERDIQPSA